MSPQRAASSRRWPTTACSTGRRWVATRAAIGRSGCAGTTSTKARSPSHPGERQAAVDDEGLPGYVAGLVLEQEDRHVRDLPCGPLTPERDWRALPARSHLRREPAERRVDQARREQVRAD